jgi:hypothetical protein
VIAYRLAYERAPSTFTSSRYGYFTREAAICAVPTLNSVRAARREAPYTHVAIVDDANVRLVELPRRQ